LKLPVLVVTVHFTESPSMKSLLTRLSLVLLASVALLLDGCALLQPANDAQLNTLIAGDEVKPADPQAAPSVLVQLHAAQRPLGQVRVPLKPGMLVDEVIVRSGASKYFTRMTIKVFRSGGPAGTYLPLEAEYDYIKERVRAESNYALQPGDYVVVTEDATTAFDDMFGQLLGPLSGFVQ
jgi:hypothetical protein